MSRILKSDVAGDKMINDASIRKLFAEYEKAFAELDVEKQAKFFADTFISAGPRGAITQSKAEFLKLAGQAVEFYKKVGQNSVKFCRRKKRLSATTTLWSRLTGE